MTKFKIGVVMTIVVALIFVFLGGSIFSIIIPTDWLFLIIYALALTVLILIFRKVEKPAIYIGIAVLICVMTLVSLIGYRAWNREDFYIDADEIIKGGTGYDIQSHLPVEVDMMQPDYDIYPLLPKDVAYGFLTRGCPNKCKWCVVPRKEGGGRNKAIHGH